MNRLASGGPSEYSFSKTAIHSQPQKSRRAISIVLAGGVGSRFEAQTPKQLARIAGQSVLHHTLSRLDESDELEEIIVAANPDWFDTIHEITRRAVHDRPWTVVNGGATRNSSVAAALTAIKVDEAPVLIHDSVRPLVTSQLIKRVSDALQTARSVIPVVPSVDPMVEINEGTSTVANFKERKNLMRGQSPQGFWLSDLRVTFASGASDREFETVFEQVQYVMGRSQVATVPGDLNNIKITMPVDYLIAGRLLLDG